MSEPVCRFCDETPDGDLYGFADAKRTRCTKRRCLIAWQQEYDRKLREDRDRSRFMLAMRRKDGQRRGKRRMFRRAA